MAAEQSLYWIWLAQACGVASKSFVRLIDRFSDPFEIYSLDEEQIEHIEGIGEKLKARLCDKQLEGAYSVIRACKSGRIDIITYGDKRYPSRLKKLEDAPAVLFCKGRFPDFDSRLCIGIVGTRKMSEYGKESAYKIAYEMAAANVVVVSGMALGIDSVAACGALAASGCTVAVLGCGVDVVYPKQHAALYERIAKHGAVISEFMPSSSPDKYNFPIRNRIISGLCQGTLVVEGDRRSGALITARSALMQGRDVFALPGKINESNSEGPNELIRDGANAALGAEDILSSYDFLYGDVINYKGLRKAQRKSALDESMIDELGVCARSYKVEAASVAARIEYGENEKEKNNTTSQRAENERTEVTRQKATEEIQKEAAPRDDSVLDGLDAGVRKIFEEMPIDTAVSPDMLVGEGADVSDVITALTFLELCGLVSSLPGGLYIRK